MPPRRRKDDPGSGQGSLRTRETAAGAQGASQTPEGRGRGSTGTRAGGASSASPPSCSSSTSMFAGGHGGARR